MAEKQGSPVIPTLSMAPQPTTSSHSKRWLTAAAALLALPALGYYAVGPANIKTIQSNIPEWKYFVPSYSAALLSAARCPAQPSALNVGNNWDPVTDEPFAKLAATRLSKAVQINTESFDDMPQDGSDPAFDHHRKFSAWLESEYPALFSSPLRHEYVNSHAHLFTWEGSNPALAPIVLMAHTDTVPVLPATIDQWTFPPLEGRIVENATEETPGTWIWGRGSSDCKNQMLGIYNAVEKLLSEGFKPERTILIVNGFDEEIGGRRGSRSVARRIEEIYGKNSVAFVVDEGFSGIMDAYGRTFAGIGMAEKGTTNVVVTVEAPGGHSSVPPKHTAIGVMALLLAELENNPFEPVLDPQGPFLKYLSCLSEYAPDLPKKMKNAIKDPKKWKLLAHTLAAKDRIINSFLATTQAIDVINGGVKINALPEVVTATINHRISFTSSINETFEHVKKTLEPVVHELNFTLTAFGEKPSTVSPYHVTLTSPIGFEPAPITSAEDPSFPLIAGTVKTIFGEEVIVAPTGMFANTDTRHFWRLTHNLFRLTPARITEGANMHTVNERMSLHGHLTTTRFFYKLIHNSVGWQG